MTLVLEAVTGYLAQLWAWDMGRGCVECGWWWVRVSPNARGEGSACLAITMGHSGEMKRAGMVSIVGIAVFDVVQPDGEIGWSNTRGAVPLMRDNQDTAKKVSGAWWFYTYTTWVWNNALPVL